MSFRLSRSVGFAAAGITLVALMAGAAVPSPLYPIYQRLWGFSSFTLTAIFAVYVVALVGALLTIGSLADHVGRRPMLVGGMVLLAISTVLFAHAGGVEALVLARVVQGLATGAIIGAVNALIIDLQPDPRSGSMATGGGPGLGLALGAALAGGLVQHAPWPRELVFWVLFACYGLLAAAALVTPEERRQRADIHGIRRALRPSVGIAPEARSTFLAWAPALTATWALGSLYLSLGSSAVSDLFGIRDHLEAGLVIAAFFLPAALVPLVIRAVHERLRRPLGLTALGGGVVISIGGLIMWSDVAYIVGSIVAGVGFGVTFQAAVAAIGATTPANKRAQTFAATYVLGYAAFSVPAVIAGIVAQNWGLRPTLVGYGVFEIALLGAAAVLAPRTTRRPDVRPPRELTACEAPDRSALCPTSVLCTDRPQSACSTSLMSPHDRRRSPPTRGGPAGRGPGMRCWLGCRPVRR